MGTATGSIVMRSERMYDLFRVARRAQRWLQERLGVFARRYLRLEEDLDVHGVKAVKAMSLNYVATRSAEEFEGIQFYFPPKVRAAAKAASGAARIEILR